ncbi:MAG: phosphoribosyltransferase family protein [Calditerrivibrio sp.]|nr:phosphoribosyltransferase family protein [Calditerrivibrio sp.]
MMKSKRLLYDMIVRFGSIRGDVVDVGAFLNHLVLPEVLNSITDDFIDVLKGVSFDKILTVESSGIPLATALSLRVNKPFVFIKKNRPITMFDFIEVCSFSFTKKNDIKLFLSKDALKAGEKVVFVDDFYAKGSIYGAVNVLADKVGFEIVRYLVVINKADNQKVFSILDNLDLRMINDEKKYT